MSSPISILIAIVNKLNLDADCIATEIFQPDDANNFFTLVVQYTSDASAKLNFDCSIIPGPDENDHNIIDLQIFSSLVENFSLVYLRDVIWTICKINLVQPFGHFGVSIEDKVIYWKYTSSINLGLDEEIQAEMITKRLKKARIYIADMVGTLVDVSTGKELPSAALKKNKWAQYF